MLHHLAVHIVVIVLAIVRHCKGNANREQYKMNSFIFIAEMQLTLSKGCIIILDNLQLPGIFSFIINRQAISLTTCILDAAWVRAVRVEQLKCNRIRKRNSSYTTAF